MKYYGYLIILSIFTSCVSVNPSIILEPCYTEDLDKKVYEYMINYLFFPDDYHLQRQNNFKSVSKTIPGYKEAFIGGNFSDLKKNFELNEVNRNKLLKIIQMLEIGLRVDEFNINNYQLSKSLKTIPIYFDYSLENGNYKEIKISDEIDPIVSYVYFPNSPDSIKDGTYAGYVERKIPVIEKCKIRYATLLRQYKELVRILEASGYYLVQEYHALNELNEN